MSNEVRELAQAITEQDAEWYRAFNELMTTIKSCTPQQIERAIRMVEGMKAARKTRPDSMEPIRRRKCNERVVKMAGLLDQIDLMDVMQGTEYLSRVERVIQAFANTGGGDDNVLLLLSIINLTNMNHEELELAHTRIAAVTTASLRTASADKE